MEKLFSRHNALVKSVKVTFVRYLMDQIPWQERLLGIKGARGVGKTTLLLQYIKTHYGFDRRALYVTLDDIYFTENNLIDLADSFVARGGVHLFLDEVHKYPDWQVELKNIYDYHPHLQVVFTGSSLLGILNAKSDLSRRALTFNMRGMSFREYLLYRYSIPLPRLMLSDILQNHEEVAAEITSTMKPLQYFQEYNRIGYFPFFENNEIFYFQRLKEVVNMTLEIELPFLRGAEPGNIPKIKKLLYVISKSVPFKPNISALASKTGITRNALLEYINHMADARILNMLHKDRVGISLLQKPEKVYLDNPNLIYALSESAPELGNVRETFLLNQLMEKHMVTYPDKGDFFIDNNITLEVGGKNKTNKQIEGLNKAFIVADDIEIGSGKRIPLWLFGFLY